MGKSITTPEFRAGFISVFKATKGPNSDPDAKPTYSIRALFPPTADLKPLFQLAEDALRAKWGDNIPKAAITAVKEKLTARNGDQDKPFEGVPEDWISIRFSATEKFKPTLVDAKRNDITDEADVYAGAFYRAHIDAYAFDKKSNKGVTFGLLAVQKVRDGAAIGRAAVKASSVFEAYDDGDNSSDSTDGGLFS